MPILQANMNFNSHAHVERDITYGELKYHKTISTHTLTWSVTGKLLNNKDAVYISTHTLTWSVTLLRDYPPGL